MRKSRFVFYFGCLIATLSLMSLAYYTGLIRQPGLTDLAIVILLTQVGNSSLAKNTVDRSTAVNTSKRLWMASLLIYPAFATICIGLFQRFIEGH